MKLFLLYIIFAVLSCAAYFVKKRLHKIDQSQFSDEDALRIYEGKLLVCPYRDEALSPQLIFDTSQLEDRGLMAMIYVNEDQVKEPVLYKEAMIMYDEEGICSVIIL